MRARIAALESSGVWKAECIGTGGFGVVYRATGKNDGETYVLKQCKDYGEAEKHYRRAIAIGLNDAVAHTNLGWVLFRHRQDMAGAEKHCRTAIEIQPEFAK